MNSSLEILEARIAPAKILNPMTVVYTDKDGDLVTLKLSKGLFESDAIANAVLKFDTGAGAVNGSTTTPEQLQLIDLQTRPVTGMTITVTAVRTAAGGDSFANVGAIKADLDLGAVTIKGDLGVIFAGDNDTVKPGLASLTVQSMGRFGNLTQGGGAATLVSQITGGLGSFLAKGDVRDVDFGITGDLGKLTINGSLFGGNAASSGSLTIGGKLGALKIVGDIRGGDGNSSGRIDAAGAIGSVLVGGAIRGGDGENSGQIFGRADLGVVTIKGGILGGAEVDTGSLIANGSVKGITLGGSLVGRAGEGSGRISIGVDSGSIKILGNVVGGSGEGSGEIDAGGAIKGVTIAGSVFGGTASSTGLIFAADAIGTVTITGDLLGGDADDAAESVQGTGAIRAGRLPSVTLGGSIVSGRALGAGAALVASGAIVADFDIGKLTIKGGVFGSVDVDALIAATGQPIVLPGATTDVAIKSISILGSVDRAVIDAGFGFNADAQIGTVTVGGDWSRSSIAAGTDPVNDLFGGAADTAITGGNDTVDIHSRIGAIIIKGQAIGTPGGGGEFGFVAQQIGSVKIESAKITLDPIVKDTKPIGTPGDLFLLEIAG